MSRAVLILASLVSACGSVTPKMPPEVTGGVATTTYLAKRMPTPAEKFAIHSVENSYFGVTDTRRGSLALGVLLGPIGVATNMAQVRGESQQRSGELKSLLAVDAGALLRAEAPDLLSADGVAIGGRHLEVVPAATLIFIDDDTFQFICFVNAAMLEGTRETWRARYGVNAEGRFNVKSAGLSGTMAAELSACLKRAHGLYQAHLTGQLGPFRDYTVETTDLTLYMPLYESGLPTRVIGNDGIGLIELRRSGVRKLTPR